MFNSRKAVATYAIRSIFAVLATIAAILIFDFCRFTKNTINCWSSEYGPQNYLAWCPGASFLYETGAIYYDLESGISEAIRNAQVIFLGSSKLQAAFSTHATDAYFAKQNIRFYVLGFGASNSSSFILSLLKHKRASPNLLIVNADPFFIAQPPGANTVFSGGLRTYWGVAKRAGLQRLQRTICPSFPSFCSPPERTIYRSANTGQWRWQGSYPEQSIPFNELSQHEISDNEFKAAVDFGERFLREIKIDRGCIVFTGIPNNEIDAPAIASRLAQRLGTQLILPKVEPLFLLDDAHLNFDSAERWSAVFLSELTPVLQRCLSKRKVAINPRASQAPQ
jgi:hypothetical protein